MILPVTERAPDSMAQHKLWKRGQSLWQNLNLILKFGRADCLDSKHIQVCCAICGAIEQKDCVEVFGIILGKELGCSACIGVTFFPFGEHR